MKAYSNKSHEEDIRNSYRITEKGGTLWITHMGDGVMSFPPAATVSHVINEINSIRRNAVCYHRGSLRCNQEIRNE